MARKVVRKRRVRKSIPLGVAHIHSTFNNTIVTIINQEQVLYINSKNLWSLNFVAICFAIIKIKPIMANHVDIRSSCNECKYKYSKLFTFFSPCR